MKDIRQKRLMELERFIQRQQVVSLGAICEAFDVSMYTVRRDISTLIQDGVVIKVHGGVMYKAPGQPQSSEAEILHFPGRSLKNVEGKAHIGTLAAALVEDGDTVFIDSGTTTAEIVTKEFLEKDILVISNSLPVFERLQGTTRARLYALGGMYISDARAFTGAKAIAELGSFSVTKAFLGASAVSLSFGVSNNLSYEIDLKRAVAEQAKKVILMVDSDKLGKNAAMKICAIDRLYALITDKEPIAEYLSSLRESGVQVIF